MAVVSLTIGGYTYDIACREGGQAHLTELAAMLDAKVDQVRGSVGAMSEVRQLLMAGLVLADDLGEAKLASAQTPPAAPNDDAAIVAIAGRLERLATRLEKTAVST